jgi:lipopolysaccharide transport system ATP-binding protein
MNDDVLVKVDNVSKKFCRDLKKSLWYGVNDIAGEVFCRNGKRLDLRKEEFWALKDVSFELRRGECLGLIGPNGAGKSTLLRLLNGLIKPDSGEISVRGRVGALIALGAGFNPILTGRENIYVNGAVLGLTKREIDKKLDEIIDFAEIGDFIDAPVQSYSSGMQVRLGFAVAAHTEPNILLVDEVLAVGDMNFRRKCMEAMKAKTKEGVSIILVTHSMHSLLDITREAILLNGGKIQFQGSVQEAVKKYLDYTNKVTNYGHLLTATRRGSGEARITKACIVNERGNEINELSQGDAIRIRCSFKVNRPIREPVFFFTIKDAISREIILFCSSENLLQSDLLESDGEFDFVFENPNLGPRRYYLCGGIVVKGQYDIPVDMWDDAGEQFIIKYPVEHRQDELYLLHDSIVYSPYQFELQLKPERTNDTC